MSATNLQKVIDEELGPAESVDYLGFHIVHQHKGKYHIQADGHAGMVGEFHVDEFDSALELVDEINRYDTIREEHMYYGDDDAMIGWAGKLMTSDEEKADEEPEKYVYIPPADERPDVDVDELLEVDSDE